MKTEEKHFFVEDNQLKPKKTMDKKIIALIIMGLIILAGAGYYAYNYIFQKGFQSGIQDATIQIASQQTATGNILLISNETIKTIPIGTLCGSKNVR